MVARMPRLLIYIVAIPLVLVLAIAALLPLLLDEARLIQIATETLEERSGAKLRVNGDAGLSLLPRLSLRLEDTELQLPGEQQPDISVQRLSVDVFLLPLLSKEVAIKGIELAGLEVTVPAAEAAPASTTAGLSDAELQAFYVQRRQALRAGAEAGAGAALGLPLALNIANVTVSEARVRLLQPNGAAPQVIDIPSLQANDINLEGRPAELGANVEIAGEQALAITLQTRFTVSADQSTATVEALTVTIAGATPEPVKLQASGTIGINTQRAQLALELASGEITGQGTLAYSSFESPQIDAKLRLNLLDPALLLLAGPDAAATANTDTDGEDTALPLDAIRLADTRADLQVERAVFGPHTINNLRLRLRALEGVLKLDTITGTLHGGALSASGSLDAHRATAVLSSRGELTGLDSAALLAALESEPLLTGLADARWELQSRGNTSDTLLQNLQGPLNLTTRDMVLQQFGVERMLCEVVAQVNQASLSAQLPQQSTFEDLSARVTLGEGKAQLDPLQANLEHIGLRGTGSLDLNSNAFNATFSARLAPTLSELDPACRVNERLTAISWPVLCSGTLDGSPASWCRVDSKDIIASLTRNELERKAKEEGGRFLQRLFKGKDSDGN